MGFQRLLENAHVAITIRQENHPLAVRRPIRWKVPTFRQSRATCPRDAWTEIYILHLSKIVSVAWTSCASFRVRADFCGAQAASTQVTDLRIDE